MKKLVLGTLTLFGGIALIVLILADGTHKYFTGKSLL